MEKFDLVQALKGRPFIFDEREYIAERARNKSYSAVTVTTCCGHAFNLNLLLEKAHMKPEPVERWAGIKVYNATTISTNHYPSKEMAEDALKGNGYTIVKVDEA